MKENKETTLQLDANTRFPARGQIFFWFVRPRKKLYSCVVTYYFICFATKQFFLSYPAITFSRSYEREISLSPPPPFPPGRVQ